VLNVLLKLSQQPHAAISLITRGNLLSWIEMQISLQSQHNSFRDFDSMWLQVIENLLISTSRSTEPNYQRLENATNGVWRDEVLRCLDLLIRRIKCSETSEADGALQKLLIAARSLQRLSETPYTTTRLGPVLKRTVDVLKLVENYLDLNIVSEPDQTQNQILMITINQPQTQLTESFRLWVDVVRRCWLALMQMKTPTRGDPEQANYNSFSILTARIVALSPLCRATAHSNTFDFETSSHRSLNNRTGNSLTEIQDTVEWARNETLAMLRAPQ